MAAADVPEYRDKHQDDEAVRERDGRIMVNTEHDCRRGTDEDQREGANEHGGQGPRRTGCCFSH